MNDSVELVINKLEQLAVALRIGVEQIYPYFVERVVVEAAVGTLIIILGLGMTWYLVIQSSIRAKKSGEDSFEINFPLFLGAIVSVFLGIGLMHEIPNLLSPEVVAMERIINMIK